MNQSQVIIGIIMIAGGIILSFVAMYNAFRGASVVALIYGLPILIIGFFILFNKNEDKIEQIKHERRSK